MAKTSQSTTYFSFMLMGALLLIGNAVAQDRIWTTSFGQNAVRSALLNGTGTQIEFTQFAVGGAGIEVDQVGGHVYYGLHDSAQIRRANLDGSNDILLVSASRPLGVKLVRPLNKIYWVDWDPSRIRRANLDGSAAETVIVTNGTYEVTYHEATNQIYWAERITGLIRRANPDGTNATTITTVSGPMAFGLDEAAGLMFWGNTSGQLYRANIDGTNITLLRSGLGWPWALDFNPQTNRILAVDNFSHNVRACDYDGGNVANFSMGGAGGFGGIKFVMSLPAAPGSPGATGITTNQITWTWGDASNNESGFKVFADPGASAPTTLRTTTAANTTSWNYTGLTPNTQYAFQVAATNGAGDSAKTTLITRRTLAATPLAPVLGNPTGDTLEVSIAAGDGNPTGTQYALRETGSGLWVQTNGSLGASAVFRSNTAWDVTTVTGLSEATAYSFTARARNNVDLIETADSPPANLSTLDVTAPTVLSITPTATGPTNADTIDFEIVFDEAVQNFDDVSDLDITHSGTAHTGASFSGSGDSYTVAVEGLSGDGSFTVAVSLASDVEDLSGNGLASSPTSDAVFLDNTPPEATLSSAAGAFVNGPITVTITLSETASDFEEGDWDLDNATASDFAGSGTDYSLTLTAQSEGSFGMSLPAGVFTDAAGNGNLPSATLSRSHDVSSPSFSNIVATPAEASAGMEVVITFDSSEALLAPAEVTVNGHPTTATLKSGSSASYVVSEADPLGAATIVISGFDLAGNLGTENNNTALMIVSAEPEVPVGGLLPLAIFLSLFGAAALRKRR